MPGHSSNHERDDRKPRAGQFTQGERPRRETPSSFEQAPRREDSLRREEPTRREPSFRKEFAPRRESTGSYDTPLQRPAAPQRSSAPYQRPAPARIDSSREQDPDYTEPQKAIVGIPQVEALLKDKPGLVHRVLFLKDSGDKRLYELQKKVKHLHIHHQQLEAKVLDNFGRGHQGVVALCNEQEVASWESVRTDLFLALETNSPRTVAVVINIEDPRNLGACLRSAYALGVTTVLLASKGMCGLTPLAARASAGALGKVTLCRPANLEAALGELVSAGYDLVGMDTDTPLSLHGAHFKPHAVIAIGGEDRSLPPFIRKQCTQVLRIPMMPDAHSYNASVALTLALYECARDRGFPQMNDPPPAPEFPV